MAEESALHYYIALSIFLLSILSLFLIWQAWRYFRTMWLWKTVQKESWPAEWRRVLEKIPHYRALPEPLKERLRPRMLFFVRTKEFVGVGLTVTEEMKAVISFYACLLVLNLPDECYGELMTILVYPYDMVAEEVRAHGGIYEEGRLILEGRSSGDTVVIAWNEAKRQAYHLRHHNVVLHEFAHVLDFEDGIPDGVPPLERSRYHRWTSVLYKHYQALKQRSQKGRHWDDYRLIGEYAATNEAEFFAVVTELFFQKPHTLKSHFPDLYEEFKSFYGLDTEALFNHLES